MHSYKKKTKLNLLKINVEKHIKRIVPVLISFILIACDTSLTPNRWESDGYADLVFDMRLSRDTNGFYHLVLDRNNWQTLHRVSALVTENDNDKGVENFRIEWDASHYWYIGDTLGYIVKRNFDSQGQYVTYETIYLTQFTGMEVPTTNQVSLSNGKGEINNMIAPVKSMIGDTMRLTADWYMDSANFYIVLD
jgi:hypothetical protein